MLPDSLIAAAICSRIGLTRPRASYPPTRPAAARDGSSISEEVKEAPRRVARSQQVAPSYLAKLSLTSETRRAAIAKAANMGLSVTIYANPLYEIDLGFEKVDMTFLVVHERLEQIPARIILHAETIFGRLLIERACR